VPLLIAAYAGVLLWAIWQAQLQWWLLPMSLLLNLLAFGFYGFDKRAAQLHQRRTPENTLHLLALAGGWPAAWLAQRTFRHKTQKRPFRIGYGFTVLLHCAALAAWLLRAPLLHLLATWAA
jgi:uncharacterized membrane protein YsdA (DUF1294 family)